ncbi:MAG: helicase C-terminal domain-containing protein [Actinomycetota bacterium]|nr:helicase C-terminal domain-containing protein [Actinomycetota bacterium]
MTNRFEPTVEQQSAMADHLVDAVILDATGERDGDRCVGEPPSAKYFLATLAPQDLNLAAGRERRGRETPSSAGFEFEVVADRAVLEVRATVSCYYRVFPTLEEQLAYRGGDDDPADRIRREYRLAPAYQRVEVDSGALALRLDPQDHVQHVGLVDLAAGFSAAGATAAGDPHVDRRNGDDRAERFVPGDVLATEEDFGSWLAALPGTPVVPEWAARITALTRPVADGRFRVQVSLENLSDDPKVAGTRRGQPVERHDDARDHFLFRVRLECGAEPGVIVPIEMYLGPDAYRYDPRLHGYANNCGLAADSDPTGRFVRRLWSVAAPTCQTRRMVAKEHPATEFSALADDPLPLLDGLAQDMRAWMASDAWSTAGLRDEMAARKLGDRDAFEAEIRRFEDGIAWLRRDGRLLLAFRLANRTMVRLGEMSGKRHWGWRLFQLVFIVSQLSALAWREYDPSEFTPGLWGGEDDRDPTAAATVLFFPTSGGKTEAYLGLSGCAMFYDRARGKGRGITAWCRFPLRLLTLQQTQRQVEFVAAAEEVRQEAEGQLAAVGGGGGDPFALGFFAGEGNTPNSLSRDQSTLDRLITDAERRREVRVVDECPYCHERTVEVLPPDPSRLRLEHSCTHCNRVLPVVVVDTEVYRYLPALIVGTLDKLANIGLSDRFGSVLGDVDCECSLHGLGRGQKCHERRAKGHPKNTVRPLSRPLYDASPSLEIVDELHMVDEDLGAFSGHYEGILAVAQRRLSAGGRPDGRGVRMKVVATTATIKGEDRQVDHLFGLRSVVIPLPGPSLEESFYWRLLDEPMRRFIGVQPNRTTAEQTLVRMLQAFHKEIRHLQAAGPSMVRGLGAMSSDDFEQLLDLYRVSLTYVTSLVDFGKLSRSMETQVNEHMRLQNLRPVPVRELSGDTSFDDVRITLDHLTGSGETEGVIATSMVSHGVDVDRLNVMVFNGMPKSMAEYIQASSRVGRRYLGIVFMIFNPIRERDRSHFRYHAKFHEYLDRMVEPVAINRWSAYAARKTLPGVLMAEILQTGNRDFWDSGRAPAHLHDLTQMQSALRSVDAGGLESVRPEALLEALGEAYLTDRDEAEELRPELDDRVHIAVDSIRAAGAAASASLGGRPQYRGTGDYLGLEYTPMTSLRDIAEGIPFYVLQERKRS